VSLASRAGDLYFTFRFLKLLTTPWEETDAFKLGLLDEKGARIKSKKAQSDAEKSAYTPFHRLVYNVKRLINKVPGGSSKIASYAAALFLLKEEVGVTDKAILKIVEGSDMDVGSFITEQSEWYLLEDKQLSPGIYKVRNEKITTRSHCVVKSGDKIRILDESYPAGELFGLDVYKAVHLNTEHEVFVTLGEIYK
tara:strand:+ start:818 stop:1402 length:585 start_codon:yes stop_codon:yes gene_type:complete